MDKVKNEKIMSRKNKNKQKYQSNSERKAAWLQHMKGKGLITTVLEESIEVQKRAKKSIKITEEIQKEMGVTSNLKAFQLLV